MGKEVVVQNTTRSFPVFGLLGIILVTLKALDLISISWFWAIAPFWIPFAILFGILALFALGAGMLFLIIAAVEWAQKRK